MERQRKYLSEVEVSELTGRALKTLRNDRHFRTGLPFIKVGRRQVRYDLNDIIRYMDAHKVVTKN